MILPAFDAEAINCLHYGFTITGGIVGGGSSLGGGIVPGMDCSMFKPLVEHGVSRT
jgi:hypothetical protein